MATKKVKSVPGEINRESIADVASTFKLISDPTRIHILVMLETGEVHVGAICDTVHQSQPAVSHHLSLLRASRLVIPRRDGKNNFYSLTDQGKIAAKTVRSMITPTTPTAKTETTEAADVA